MIKITKFLVATFLLLVAVSCSNKDSGEDQEPIIPINKIQASFDFEVSETDGNLVYLNNTTLGSGEYTSVWDFGKGGATVNDASGKEEVRYDAIGEYTVTLTVTNTAGSTSASKNILVDEGGICPNGVCSSGSGTLKDAATDFSVGMITRASYINGGGQHTALLKQEFNNLSSEYEMKMNIMYPSEDTYDFSAGDVIVAFAQENDMNVHGHALIWHNATPSWVEDFTGTDAEFEAMVEDYITTTMNHFKGKVRSWDVVNEAIADDNGNALRGSIFKDRMGDDYVRKCFQFARNADPDALLFYNDYNFASSASKRAAIFNLIDGLGDLIDGAGAQMHISYNGPAASEIQAVVNGTVSRNLLMHFSELDIRANPEKDEAVMELSSARGAQQQAKFKEVVQIYNAIPIDNKFALTVWGLRDNESWLLEFHGVPDWPLLFDENYDKKLGYIGFLEGLD